YSPINLKTIEQEEIAETDNETTGNTNQSSLLPGEQEQSQTQCPTRRTNRIMQDHNYQRLGNPDTRLPAAERTMTAKLNEDPTEKVAEFEEHNQTYSAEQIEQEPMSLREAKASPDWEKWEAAIMEELQQLDEM